MTFIPLKVTRRDSDATLGVDGDNQSLYNNAIGRLKVSTMPAMYDTITGTITTSTSTVAADVARAGSATVTISGTYAGVNMSFEAYDGVNWFLIPAQPVAIANTQVTATGVITANSSLAWDISPIVGFSQIRVRATAYTSGTANIRIMPSAAMIEPAVQVNGTISANKSGTWPGDSSLTPGTGATNLGKAEDATHTSGDTGVFMLGVRNDGMGTTTSASGDYSQMSTDRAGRVMVAQQASSAALTNVAGSATSVTILAANSARIGATITNDSSALLYLKFGATASTTSYTVVLAGAASAPFSYYEVPAGYTGIVDGIWSSAAGNARVTEIS